jgi:hypothetical protein
MNPHDLTVLTEKSWLSFCSVEGRYNTWYICQDFIVTFQDWFISFSKVTTKWRLKFCAPFCNKCCYFCKILKIVWFEEANINLSGRCGDWDVAGTHLSLTLPSNKPEYYSVGVLFPTFVFWGPFFLDWIVMSESYVLANAAMVYITRTLTIARQQFQRFVL